MTAQSKPSSKTSSPIRLRALVDMSLRRSKDTTSPLYEEWIDWKAGDVFEPPPHMNVSRCLERGIVEEVEMQRYTNAEVAADG